MRKLFFLVFILLFSIQAYPQGTKKDTVQTERNGTAQTSKDTTQIFKKSLVDHDSSIIKINSNIDTIKKNLAIIKINTEPPSVLGEYITNKILDKIYDLLFGGEDKPGLIPFILSLIGLALGLIRFIVLIVRFRKIKGEKLQKVQGIIIAFLLFLTSSLLFILTNRNFKSAETVKLDNLDSKLMTIHNELQANQTLLLKSSNTDNSATILAVKFEQYNLELQQIKKSIRDAEKNTATRIEEKSTNGFWVFLNFLLIIVVILLLLKDKIRELFT